MRILFLTQVLPYPLDAGPKVRAYYVLRHLLDRGHAVTLASFTRQGDSEEARAHLRGLGVELHTVRLQRSRSRDLWHGLTSLPTRTPFLVARDRCRAMRARLAELVVENRYDAIHADQLWTVPYALAARRTAGGGLMLVADRHNAVQRIPLRLAESERSSLRRCALRLEAAKLRRYERSLTGIVDHAVWVSEEDRRTVEGNDALDRSRVIPICIDPDEWEPVERAAVRPRVTFVGGLHWPPNAVGLEWFVRDVWPRVAEAAPEARLSIVGRAPAGVAARLRAAAGATPVEIVGRVDELEPYLRDAAAFVVPLHAGGGMRVKILDAWSRGVPVVSTSIGCEGIDARAGEDLLVADDAPGFAAEVARLLADRALQDRLARNGRSQVASRYNWRRSYPEWDALYPRESGSRQGVPNQATGGGG